MSLEQCYEYSLIHHLIIIASFLKHYCPARIYLARLYQLKLILMLKVGLTANLLMKSLPRSRFRYRLVPTATVVAEVVPPESVVRDIVTVGSTISVTVASVAKLLKKET